MPLRDIALTVTVVALLPLCFLRPWIGVLVWSWLGFMNPHRLVWGFAYTIPFAQMVAIATLGGTLFTRDRKPFVWNRESLALVAFWVWITITTFVALYPVEAWEGWKRFSKILLMAFLIPPFFQDRRRLRLLFLVTAGSIGYYGLKGGIWVLGTGGTYQVLGAPGDTFISTNNALALALNMTLPFFFYLAKDEPRRWLRLTLYATFFASILSVLFTYSRGGVVGLLVVLAVLFFNRRNAVPITLAAILVLGVAVSFAPDKWVDRMNTIRHYEEDSSAMARLASWTVASRLLRDHPITGGGFWSIPQPEIWDKYMPEFPGGGNYDAHSIYFGVLGEHGFPGLALYAFLAGSVVMTLRRLRRLARDHDELRWIGGYAFMLQASLTGYLVTGAFLSVAYFDLAYLIIMAVIVLKSLAEQQVPVLEQAARAKATSRPRRRIAIPAFRVRAQVGR